LWLRDRRKSIHCKFASPIPFHLLVTASYSIIALHLSFCMLMSAFVLIVSPIFEFPHKEIAIIQHNVLPIGLGNDQKGYSETVRYAEAGRFTWVRSLCRTHPKRKLINYV